MRRRGAGLIASAQRSISLNAARDKPAYDRVLGALGDLVHGREIALRGDRKAGLDDVDAHLVEQLGDLELLLMRHGGAGALLAVAQCGVEDDDAVLVGRGDRHWDWVLLARALFCGAHGFRWLGSPLSAQAHAPIRPSGDAKEQEPAKSEARPRTGQGQGPPGTSTNAAARRNHFCLVRPVRAFDVAFDTCERGT